MCHELKEMGLCFERQKQLPVKFKGLVLDAGYRLDLVVENLLVVELKCCDEILPIHEAQLLTYLRLSTIKVGLILNFKTTLLKNGIRRMVL